MSSIRLAAKVLAVMESEGDDLTQVPAHLLRMLRRINSDRMLPDIMVRLSGRLRQRAALLPIYQQRALLADGFTVEVLLPDGDVACLEPQRLTPTQISQVFGDGFIRTPTEQRAMLRKPVEAKRSGRPALEVSVDRDRGGIVYFGRFIPRATLLKWLADL